MSKNSNTIKIIMFLLLIVVSVVIFKYFNLQQYLSVNGINKYSNLIIEYQKYQPVKFLLLFFSIYVGLLIFCISGTVFLDIMAGFILGIIGGTVLIMISYTIGIILNYIVVNYLLKDFFANRFKNSKFLKNIPSKKHVFMSLLSLRMIPVLPFWSLNIIASILSANMWTFISSTIIGIIPVAYIYSLLGNNLRSVFLSNQHITENMLFNYKIWLPLFLLSMISVMPLLWKKYKSVKSK
jgi:uncharacterized membrane protein YdjX (TVP38/TMEM64 family)